MYIIIEPHIEYFSTYREKVLLIAIIQRAYSINALTTNRKYPIALSRILSFL